MAKNRNVISLSDLKEDASAAFKRVRKSKRPVVVTQRGRPAAVMLSVNAYERGERERAMLKLLALGEKEIATGAGYELDDVIAEADALLGKV